MKNIATNILATLGLSKGEAVTEKDENLLKIASLLQKSNKRSFEAIRNLAFNSPDACYDIMRFFISAGDVHGLYKIPESCYFPTRPREELIEEEGVCYSPAPIIERDHESYETIRDLLLRLGFFNRERIVKKQDSPIVVEDKKQIKEILEPFFQINEEKCYGKVLPFICFIIFYIDADTINKMYNAFKKEGLDTSLSEKKFELMAYFGRGKASQVSGLKWLVDNAQEAFEGVIKDKLSEYWEFWDWIEEEYEHESPVDTFVNACIVARTDVSMQKKVDGILKERFGKASLQAMKYFLSLCNEDTIRHFAERHLPPEDFAAKSTVDIVIKRIDKNKKKRGNTGNYLIYVQKEDDELKQLEFTHQVSCVYYLMYLIDHYTRSHDANRISLRRNKDEFMKLYKLIYYIGDDTFNKRYADLLYREDKYGEIRPGREKEIISDIRKQMSEAFAQYDESIEPYVMKANRHLFVNRDRIHFVDEAEELLNFKFR